MTLPGHMKAPPVIGITLGDINGIGPEIAFKALAKRPVAARQARLAVIGHQAVIAAAAQAVNLSSPPPWRPGRPWPGRAAVAQWNPNPDRRPPDCRPGKVTAAAGRAAAGYLEAAGAALVKGTLAGVVTAPVCKQSLQRAGWRFPGQTEWLAHLSGARRTGMLLAGKSLRVILATRHLPLAAVPAAVTRQAVRDAAELLAEGLAWLGIGNQRIGVCALNPHAGDGGMLGREDDGVIAPAVRGLRRRGLQVEGPLPADVIFHLALTGRFGGLVAMYHDQGLAPLKTVDFFHAVNITLGLPFVRTSPDHGTAFDIAGRNRADARSMTAAIRLAARLVHRTNPWASRPPGPRTAFAENRT